MVAPVIPDLANAHREELHLRRIEMRGFRRGDGLYEIEGRITDTKPTDFTPASSDTPVPAGDAIHDMWLVLVFDEAMTVHEVRAGTQASPYAVCPMAAANLQTLVGLSMTRGWNEGVRQRLARSDNCTHLAGLLGPMATTAFQALSVKRADGPVAVDSAGRPLKIDSCYAYSAERDLVRERWPEHARASRQGREDDL